MDLVLRLRELRRASGMSQKDVADRSGLGVRTISSFESGSRIGSMKISQLERLLQVYGVSEREFFGGEVDERFDPFEAEARSGLRALNERLMRLPDSMRNSVCEQLRTMLESGNHAPRRGATHAWRMAPMDDWQLLNSHN